MTKAEEKLKTLAEKFVDKDTTKLPLFLLDEIHEIEDRLDEDKKEIEQEISELKDLVSPTSQEVKAVIEQTGKLIEEFSGVERLKGDKGEKGEKGAWGERGAHGTQGLQGERGVQGERGEKGDIGETGIVGKDGSPDTPEEIAVKLNTLEETIEQKVIKGLAERLERLEEIVRRPRGGLFGGGGGRKMRTETFSFDGGASTFLLPAEPDGKGKLIWVYYNSAWLHNGTHYNIAGKTLTTTFVTAQGTKIEGFLIVF